MNKNLLPKYLKATFLTLLMTVVYLFSVETPAFAYIYQLTVWKNKHTGQMLYVASDGHNLGTKAENTQQMNFFIDKVVDAFEKEAVNLNVLVEDKSLYFVDINKTDKYEFGSFYVLDGNPCVPFHCEVIGHGSLKVSFTKTPTWLMQLVPQLKIWHKDLKYVSLASVDPRIIASLWELQCDTSTTSFNQIFNVGKNISELEQHLEKNSNDPLSIELRKIDKVIKEDKEKLLSLINKSPADEQSLNSRITKDLIAEGKLSEDDVKKVHAYITKQFELGSQTPLLTKTLDRVALWKLASSNSSHTFLDVGGLHTDALASHLVPLGYEKIEQFGASTATLEAQAFWNSDEHGQIKMLDGLKEEIERGLLKISSELVSIKK